MAKPLGISSLFIPQWYAFMFDSRPYLNIVGKILSAKCRVVGDTPCIRRMPSYDLNVTNLWKLAVTIDTSSFGHLEEGILLTPFTLCPTLWPKQSLSNCKHYLFLQRLLLKKINVFPLLLRQRHRGSLKN